MYSAAASDTAVASVSVSGTTVTVSAVAEGPAMVTVTARDPGGLAVDQSFGVTVPNLAPEAVGSIPDKELTRRLFVVVSAYFNDPDGDTLTYSAATSNSAVATVSVSDTAVFIRRWQGAPRRPCVLRGVGYERPGHDVHPYRPG